MDRISSLQNKNEKVQKSLNALKQEGISNEELSKLAIDTEKLFIDVRSFVAEHYSCRPSLQIRETEFVEEHITITENENGLKIVMPVLMPFKKLKNERMAAKPKKTGCVEVYEKCNALYKSLETALKKYCESNPVDREKYSKTVFEYSSNFNTNKRGIPDADNLEYKQITDLVVSYVSNTDDSFENVDFVFRVRKKDTTHTILRIVPQEVYEYDQF